MDGLTEGFQGSESCGRQACSAFEDRVAEVTCDKCSSVLCNSVRVQGHGHG